ncbi:hypothetical protein ACLIBH_07440 [Virgibacillus sp. W0430]|uniref:hypothetical protein n=1 Tax=Virgibacillus sp. W0430 TaxID=3391580 RepID=UPI003F4849B9
MNQIERSRQAKNNDKITRSLKDEVETLSAAYADAQKEISILKRRLENEKMY